MNKWLLIDWNGMEFYFLVPKRVAAIPLPKRTTLFCHYPFATWQANHEADIHCKLKKINLLFLFFFRLDIVLQALMHMLMRFCKHCHIISPGLGISGYQESNESDLGGVEMWLGYPCWRILDHCIYFWNSFNLTGTKWFLILLKLAELLLFLSIKLLFLYNLTACRL